MPSNFQHDALYKQLRPKCEVFIKPLLPSRPRDLFEKGKGKIVRGEGWIPRISVLQIRQDSCPCKLRDYGSIREPVQVLWNPSIERGKWSWVPLLTKKPFAIDTCWERAISFFQWNDRCRVLESIKHTLGQAQAQGSWSTQNGLRVFCVSFVLFCFVLVFWALLFLFVLSFYFRGLFYFRKGERGRGGGEREKAWIWVGRENGGSERGWGTGKKIWSKYIEWKTF